MFSTTSVYLMKKKMQIRTKNSLCTRNYRTALISRTDQIMVIHACFATFCCTEIINVRKKGG